MVIDGPGILDRRLLAQPPLPGPDLAGLVHEHPFGIHIEKAKREKNPLIFFAIFLVSEAGFSAFGAGYPSQKGKLLSWRVWEA